MTLRVGGVSSTGWVYVQSPETPGDGSYRRPHRRRGGGIEAWGRTSVRGEGDVGAGQDGRTGESHVGWVRLLPSYG